MTRGLGLTPAVLDWIVYVNTPMPPILRCTDPDLLGLTDSVFGFTATSPAALNPTVDSREPPPHAVRALRKDHIARSHRADRRMKRPKSLCPGLSGTVGVWKRAVEKPSTKKRLGNPRKECSVASSTTGLMFPVGAVVVVG